MTDTPTPAGLHRAAKQPSNAKRTPPVVFYLLSLLSTLGVFFAFLIGKYEWMIVPVFGILAFGITGRAVSTIRGRLELEETGARHAMRDTLTPKLRHHP
jgi:hypothetical protein